MLIFLNPAANAATLVIANATGETVKCQVKVGDKTLDVQLATGESKPITCGRSVDLTYTAADGPKAMRLDAYTAYLFVSKKKTGLELMAIELAGKSPGEKDIPQPVPELKPVKIPVKLLADNAERRTRPLWTTALKKRLESASEILARDAGVSFEVKEFDEWTVDNEANDLKSVMADFEKQVEPNPGMIAIGFTSRNFTAGKEGLPFAVSRGLRSPFILIRETDPQTEPERLEVLVQQLGRYLGAVSSPDPFSVMRPKLGDGLAIRASFRIGFDPLNCLAMNIIAEEARKGAAKKIAEWPEAQQVRLARIYATLNAALPNESLPEEVSGLLERAGLRVAAVPDEKPKEPGAPEAPRANRAMTAEQEAIRKVVHAITVKAEENSQKPANTRIKGDELTELYIRTAADVAFNLEEEHRKKAFLIALGIALDDSEMVRKMPVIGDLWKAVESDDERKVRIAVLGNPTMLSRRDLCQHYAISAAITALSGGAIAERIGLEKEKLDMTRPNGSGFSFSDLAADLTGIAMANYVLGNGERLDIIRQKFTIADYLPKIDDLNDGLSSAKFKSLYGDTGDKRFTDALDDLRSRVKDLKAYKVKKDN